MAKTILFVGGGNMARSLVGGLLADGYAAEAIHISDPASAALAQYEGMGVCLHEDAGKIAAEADIIVLAVKPQILREVATSLGALIKDNKPLVISVAAGIRSEDLMRWLGGEFAIVRTMPNTPALVCSGATGLFANRFVDDKGKALAESIMRAVGLTIWVNDETMLDAVTALSGSGPAYVFLVMEAMQAAGEKLGLAPEASRLLTLQTVLGAAKLAMESREEPAELRRRVTSPGGTTERGVNALESGGLRDVFEQALEAADQRAKELGDILGGA